MKKKLIPLLMVAASLLSACRTNDFYRERELVKAEKLGSEVNGGYLEVHYFSPASNGRRAELAEGEFLWLDRDSIYLRSKSYRPKAVALQKIDSYRLYFRQPDLPNPNAYLLPLLSMSHGVLGIFSLPLNAFIPNGLYLRAINRAEISDSRRGSKVMDFSQIRLYARYPTGLPPGLSPVDINRLANAASARRDLNGGL